MSSISIPQNEINVWKLLNTDPHFTEDRPTVTRSASDQISLRVDQKLFYTILEHHPKSDAGKMFRAATEVEGTLYLNEETNQLCLNIFRDQAPASLNAYIDLLKPVEIKEIKKPK